MELWQGVKLTSHHQSASRSRTNEVCHHVFMQRGASYTSRKTPVITLLHTCHDYMTMTKPVTHCTDRLAGNVTHVKVNWIYCHYIRYWSSWFFKWLVTIKLTGRREGGTKWLVGSGWDGWMKKEELGRPSPRRLDVPPHPLLPHRVVVDLDLDLSFIWLMLPGSDAEYQAPHNQAIQSCA